jgi:hypothetical protein
MLSGSVTCANGVRRWPADEDEFEVFAGRARLSFQDFDVAVGDCSVEFFLGLRRRMIGPGEPPSRLMLSALGTGIDVSEVVSNGVERPSFRVS